jgi:hypothetical protein
MIGHKPEFPVTPSDFRQLKDTRQTVVDENQRLKGRVAQLDTDRNRHDGELRQVREQTGDLGKRKDGLRISAR